MPAPESNIISSFVVNLLKLWIGCNIQFHSIKGHRQSRILNVALCQAIFGESPNTILTNICIAESNGEQTSQLMFYVRWGLVKGFLAVS